MHRNPNKTLQNVESLKPPGGWFATSVKNGMKLVVGNITIQTYHSERYGWCIAIQAPKEVKITKIKD